MNKLKTIISWGALWGILEASLGWVLHLIHFKGEVLLLYPFGLLCMMMAAKQTGETATIVKVAFVASMVKLINLAMHPAVPVFHVTNPAIAIFIEGLVTWGFSIYAQRKTSRWMLKIPLAICMVFVSILLFRGWQVFMDAYITVNPGLRNFVGAGLPTLWIERSVIQGAMLLGAAQWVDSISQPIHLARWTARLAVPLFALSIVLNSIL